MRLAFALLALSLVGCAAPGAAPDLAMAVELDPARLAQGTVAGTLRFSNAGGTDAWLYPWNPCYDTDINVTQGTQRVNPDQLAACGRRRAYTDADMVRVPAGGSVDMSFSVLGHYPLRPGHTYSIEVTYQPHPMHDDRLTVAHWTTPLRASVDVTLS